MARINDIARRLAETDESSKYIHHQGVHYENPHMVGSGCTSIDVLPFLKGRPWNNLALAWVAALRPSKIRVGQIETTDTCPQRVSVFLGDDGLISRITQEVAVLWTSGFELNRITEWQKIGGHPDSLEDYDQGHTFPGGYIKGPRVQVDFNNLRKLPEEKTCPS